MREERKRRRIEDTGKKKAGFASLWLRCEPVGVEMGWHLHDWLGAADV